MADRDDTRDRLAEALWRDDVGPEAPPLWGASEASHRVYRRTADALLPVVERLVAEGQARALRDAADDLTDRVRTWVLDNLRDRADALHTEDTP